jgi:hypothetical protein
MLEGQVAVLSSGVLDPDETVDVLNGLRKSSLYREDQATYILYPNRRLQRFTEKNNIPSQAVEKSPLLMQLVKKGDQNIIIMDDEKKYHFNGAFRNANFLKAALDKIDSVELRPLIESEQNNILELYESIFDHQSFTGRSGTFFKYEGLGSIYWHMVSKLLLTVQENYFKAIKSNADKKTIANLRSHYYEIRKGIGVTKSPDLYGAFPTDPYSHTPLHAGVQQPGMTGQVKEDIISRFGELGVMVEDGKILFSTVLLRREEFLQQADTFTYYNVHGQKQDVELSAGMLAFTFCQVPIVYHLADETRIQINFSDNNELKITDLALDKKNSESIFKRTGNIIRVDVFVKM